MILAIIAALVPVAFISFLAFSKKTSPAVRKASIIALIIIAVGFVTCSIIILVMLLSPAGTGGNGDIPVMPIKDKKQDLIAVLIVTAVMFFLILVLIIASRREQRKKWTS